MYSVVFDTVVFVRSLINPGGMWGRLIFTYAGHYRLIVSPPVVEGILKVLQRPELTRKYRGLATRNMQTIIGVLQLADVVELDEIPAISRDVKDDKVLVTATMGGAQYLVSEDNDLLILGMYEGVRIVNAATFLGILEHDVAL